MNFERPCWAGPCTSKGMAEPGFCKCKQAADEIEALQSTIRALSKGDIVPITDKDAEIERLTTALGYHVTELQEARRQAIRDANKIERLNAALKGVLSDIADYERVNNLSPNPGRKYCWDSVAQAHEALNPQ